jgi:hypothetical protein
MSWGSAIAGAVIATGVMFLLGELFMALGFGLLKPEDPSQNPSVMTIGVSGGCAWVASAILATFMGAWASGHLARQRSDADSVMHGLLVWGLGIVLMAALGTTAAGMVVGGAFSLMGSGLTVAGSAAGGMAHGVGSATGGIAQGATKGISSMMASTTSTPSFNWDSIRRTAEKLLKINEPDPAQGMAAGPGQQPTAQLKTAQTTPVPQSTDAPATAAMIESYPEDTMDLISRIFSSPTGSMSDADRTQLIAQLGAATGVSESDATHLVQHWEKVAVKAKDQFATTTAEVERTARDAAASAAKALSAAAWLAFVATALAASAGILGAHLGGLSALKHVPRPKESPQAFHAPVHA